MFLITFGALSFPVICLKMALPVMRCELQAVN